MEVDEKRRHGVEQAIAIRPRTQREAHEQAAVLDRVAEVLGGEDGLVTLRLFRKADCGHGRQAGSLEPAKDLEFGLGDFSRFFLQRKRAPVEDDETDEVSRWTDRQVAKRIGVGRPAGQRRLPGKIEQA
jgi:hypothetical protein